MIICELCKKEFGRITYAHLRKHGIENEKEYLKLYPNAQLTDQEHRDKVSKYTKMAMGNLNPEQRKAMIYERTDKIKDKISKSVSKLHEDGLYDNAYTQERADKISKKRIEYWKTADKTHITGLWMKVRDDMGEDIWKKRLQDMSGEGLHKNMIMKGPNKFEISIKNILKSENIKFEMPFKIGFKYFDFYLPDYNVLIECDGIFYHPLTEEECKYDLQKKNFKNDIKKNKLAEKKGYKLLRIREDDPNKVETIKSFLKNI